MKGLKFILGLLTYALTIGAILAAGIAWWGYDEFQKPGPMQKAALFEVQRGMIANDIAFKLYEEQLIHDPFIFMVGVTIIGEHTNLKAGEYEINPGVSAHDIIKILSEGKIFQRQITIPEGLTSYEVMRLLSQSPDLAQEEVKTSIEGILLPETYSYQKGESNADILRRMETDMQTLHDTFFTRIIAAPEDFPTYFELCKIKQEEKDGITEKVKQECWHKILTLASIVEKETGVSGERSRVAGVFINRLNRGMALQTDPTVIYALSGGKHKNEGKGPLGRRLLKKDLKFDSLYNTYKYPGLPPGPIANPGRASIEAVLNPETHEFIYFVADGTGGHAFAKTLAGHNANVAKWRKIRRQKKD